MGTEKEQLRFIRVIDPNVFDLIPRKLFEQVESLEPAHVDNLIKYGKHMLNRFESKGGEMVLVPNILVHVAVMVDSNTKIHGILWAEFDIVEELIYVQLASVEKAYQGGSRKLITDYLFGLDVDPRCKGKIRMNTAKPRAYERAGWKRSKMIIMEIDNVGETDPDSDAEA